VLHAAWLPGRGDDAVAVIIEEAAPSDVAPLVMLAYGLTEQERTITGLVCRGFSTREISERLYVSANTVQDHLKSIFDKTGVRSRRELVTTVLRDHYLPHAAPR
jgi:DNA-binding NarL/FixJ family response regulator